MIILNKFDVVSDFSFLRRVYLTKCERWKRLGFGNDSGRLVASEVI